MNLINWLQLQPNEANLERAIRDLSGVVHMRTLQMALVRGVLEGYPWEQRSDLVPVFDPSSSYMSGDIVAIPQKDKQGLRPDTWRLGEVRKTEAVISKFSLAPQQPNNRIFITQSEISFPLIVSK